VDLVKNVIFCFQKSPSLHPAKTQKLTKTAFKESLFSVFHTRGQTKPLPNENFLQRRSLGSKKLFLVKFDIIKVFCGRAEYFYFLGAEISITSFFLSLPRFQDPKQPRLFSGKRNCNRARAD